MPEKLSPEDIETDIPDAAKLIMADLVMAWARVDTAIAHLAAASFGLDMIAGSILFSRASVSDRLLKVQRLQATLGRKDQASQLKKLRETYEKRSQYRNTVCHAKCIGVLKTDEDRIVFLPFEVHVGTTLQLTMEAVSLKVMRRAIEWADKMEQGAINLLQSTGYFNG